MDYEAVIGLETQASSRRSRRCGVAMPTLFGKAAATVHQPGKERGQAAAGVHFLGFRFCRNKAGQWPIHLSRKPEERIQTQLNEMPPRHWGQSLRACLRALNRYLKGWVAYYRQCSEEAVRNWKKIDAHVQRRLRAIVIRQKKRPRYLYRHLLRRGVSDRKAAQTARSSRGVWHRSARKGMHLGYRIDRFTEHLVSLTTEWYRHNLPSLVSPVSEPQLNLFAFEIPSKEPYA